MFETIVTGSINVSRKRDKPWSPSARLFRQPAFGDWASVIERVTRELKQQLSNL